MPIYRCKMCGGTLNVENGSTVCECEYCGTKQTLPSAADEPVHEVIERNATKEEPAMPVYEKKPAPTATVKENNKNRLLVILGIAAVVAAIVIFGGRSRNKVSVLVQEAAVSDETTTIAPEIEKTLAIAQSAEVSEKNVPHKKTDGPIQQKTSTTMMEDSTEKNSEAGTEIDLDEALKREITEAYEGILYRGDKLMISPDGSGLSELFSCASLSAGSEYSLSELGNAVMESIIRRKSESLTAYIPDQNGYPTELNVAKADLFTGDKSRPKLALRFKFDETMNQENFFCVIRYDTERKKPVLAFSSFMDSTSVSTYTELYSNGLLYTVSGHKSWKGTCSYLDEELHPHDFYLISGNDPEDYIDTLFIGYEKVIIDSRVDPEQARIYEQQKIDEYAKQRGLDYLAGEISNFQLSWEDVWSAALPRNDWYQDHEGNWYYLDADANLVTEPLVLNGKTYSFYKSGAMVHDGWHDEFGVMNNDSWHYGSDSICYYGSDGAMLSSTVTPDGYSVGSYGEIIDVTDSAIQEEWVYDRIYDSGDNYLNYGEFMPDEQLILIRPRTPFHFTDREGNEVSVEYLSIIIRDKETYNCTCLCKTEWDSCYDCYGSSFNVNFGEGETIEYANGGDDGEGWAYYYKLRR